MIYWFYFTSVFLVDWSKIFMLNLITFGVTTIYLNVILIWMIKQKQRGRRVVFGKCEKMNVHANIITAFNYWFIILFYIFFITIYIVWIIIWSCFPVDFIKIYLSHGLIFKVKASLTQWNGLQSVSPR